MKVAVVYLVVSDSCSPLCLVFTFVLFHSVLKKCRMIFVWKMKESAIDKNSLLPAKCMLPVPFWNKHTLLGEKYF